MRSSAVARLRLVSVLVAVALFAVACTGDDEGGRDGGGEPSVTPPAEGGVRFSTNGGDVFAWEQQLSGSGDCASVSILVDGAEVDPPVEVADGSFRVTVSVAEGEQEIVARCTAPAGATEDSPPIMLNGRLRARPTARIDLTVRGGEAVVLDGTSSENAVPDGARVESYRWEADPRNPAPLNLGPGRADRIVVRAPAADGEYSVWLTVTDTEGREDRAGTYFVVEDGRARAVDLMHEHPAWIDSAVVYAPIHQLWGNRGAPEVEDRLEYLAELGVDALWLWPPVTTRAPGEQYAIADYFSIDPEWGDADAFKRMVDRAHELGLRVLLDFVPNHSSAEHPYFQDAEELGTASHYWDFYDRDPNGEFTHYFDWTHLPNLNFENPQVRTMMTEAFSYWIREFDVDGFRVDVAWGIKERRPDYWLEWRAELKRIKPDLMLIAEAPGVDPYYYENGFDIGYDWWQRELGRWAWVNAFEFPEAVAEFLVPALTNGGEGLPRDALLLRFLNNNDTDVRFIDRYGPEITKVAAAMEFTVSGIPLMFAGDEIGASYLPYSNLTPIRWRDRDGLDPWYRTLIRLREEMPSLQSPAMTVLTSDSSSVVSYVRPAFAGGDPVLVVLNYDRKTSVKFDADPALAPFEGTLTDVLSGGPVSVRPAAGGLSLTVDAETALVLVPGGGS